MDDEIRAVPAMQANHNSCFVCLYLADGHERDIDTWPAFCGDSDSFLCQQRLFVMFSMRINYECVTRISLALMHKCETFILHAHRTSVNFENYLEHFKMIDLPQIGRCGIAKSRCSQDDLAIRGGHVSPESNYVGYRALKRCDFECFVCNNVRVSKKKNKN